MARIALNSVDDSSISVYVTNLDTSYSKDDRYIEWYLDGDYEGDMSLGAEVSSSRTKWFSGLRPNTEYEISAEIYKESGLITTLYRTVKTETNIEPFSWDYPKRSGADVNLTASEWNKFTSFINEVRDANGYSSYDFDRVYSGNIIRGNYYKQARAAISPMTSYYIPYRETGDIIYAADLNNLVDAANNAIP